MRKLGGHTLHSPSDLVRFLGCAHATALDLQKLQDPDSLPDKVADDAIAIMVQEAGLAHEAAYRRDLEAAGGLVEINTTGILEKRVDATVAAMRSGASSIYQAAFLQGDWHGFADFLVRVDQSSAIGNWSYEPVDTKLARSVKPAHLVQLGLYAQMIEAVQGAPVRRVHVALGSGKYVSERVVGFSRTVAASKQRYEAFVVAGAQGSRGEPCSACTLCGWREHCADTWEKEDHLNRVSGLSRPQASKLRDSGIETAAALARGPHDLSIRHLPSATFTKLRRQAQLQMARWAGGPAVVEVLPPEDGRGFALLPPPDPADLFFDLEGDPLEEGGLEYLWGVHFREGGAARFVHRWAHNRQEERAAFEATVDWFAEHLAAHPGAHIYHYAPYERTALRRLSAQYASREEVLDQLQRERRFVDLYTVARQSIRTSEPSLSLKALEVFFAPARQEAVTKADQSIIEYKSFRETGDETRLQAILDYNRVDCENTEGLRNWLVSLRPDGVAWRSVGMLTADSHELSEAAAAEEAEATAIVNAVLAGSCPPSQEGRELVGHLVCFHRRAEKPAWWALFDRCENQAEELIDDGDCIGAIAADRDVSEPWLARQAQSTLARYRFPVQDTKLKVGDAVLHAPTRQAMGNIVALDDEAGRVMVKRKLRAGEVYPEAGSLIPQPTVSTKPLVKAVRRVARAWAGTPEDNGAEPRYRALVDVIERAPPRLTGWPAGPLVHPGEDLIEAIVHRCLGLDHSTLFIQGPPGTGKTYTSAHVITALLKAGKRVGVSSNSHKAINNLLAKVEEVAAASGVRINGVKKASAADPDSFLRGQMIVDVTDNRQVFARHPNLIGGTAWLFADPQFDQQLDYLFVDEAGQVSLGHLLAMGTAARNIVLVGDQMQLSQPIQGSHPGDSGLSALDYLLQGEATVPPDRGILLYTSWRMCPAICNFISEAVYDGRLHSHPDCARQKLHLTGAAANQLPSSGLHFMAMDHRDCAQRSPDEVAAVKSLTAMLLGTAFTDREGKTGEIGWDNILIVAPYNVQVNALRKALPEAARVGTVDKFQGQEAEIVIFSMTTSTPADLPRHVDFFYSKNRLNVAISRARTLAVVLANPRLLELDAQTVEHLQLVNNLAWLISMH